MSLDGDWRSWDAASKDRLLSRLKAETLLQQKIATYCEDETPSAMAKRWMGDRWHHRSYHDVLDQLALDLESGAVDRATISMPPQVGKSTWVNWLVFWTMARHPLDPLIRMSYAAELATTHARFVQGYVEEYGPSYGLLQKRGDWAQHNWHTMTGAGLRSGGMLTGVAGFPAARMVIDDPIGGRALADSKTIRDKTYNEYSANLLSRLRPGGWLLIVNCLTGETPILMADGNERPIRDVRPGDLVATYEAGILTESPVRNWANQGPDRVYAVRMASGRTVHANAGHPFLAIGEDGAETWRRTDQLVSGSKVRSIAVPGSELRAQLRAATNPSPVRDSVGRTTTKLDGLQARAGKLMTTVDVHISGIDTGSTPRIMTRSSRTREGFAPSAIARQPPRTREIAASCSSTIVTTAIEYAESSATTATSSSGTAQPSNGCSQQSNTYALTSDEVVSITAAGYEDVYDIEVDRTHNFVANGLVTHNTRWHEDDLNARVVKLEGSRWREINLPAIAWEENDPLGRAIGEPLPHPYIDPADTAAALKHWEEKRRTSTIRDWFSLYLGDPKPAEGALLTDDQVKASTYNDEIDFTTVKTGVAIDPNGGGRDVAGVIGGAFVDNTVVWTHDYSGNFGSDGWSSAACELAHEIDAGIFVYEHNYGGDQARLILRTVWKQLSDEAVARGEDDWGPCPRIEAVHAKKGKRVRAEPISAQVIFGKVKFYGLQVLDLGSEWQTWQEDSKESPGRIDASCYLAYKWLKVPGAEAVVSSIAEKPKQPTGKSRQAAKTFTRAGPGIGR